MNGEMKTSQAKKSVPQVRQTKTSLYRLARSNPLLVQNNEIESSEYRSKKIHLPSTVTSLSRRETIQKPIEIAPVIRSSYLPYNHKLPNKSIDKSKQNHKPKSTLKTPKPRRSLSAQHFERKKHVPVPEVEKEMIKAEITQSLENVAELSYISPVKKRVVTFQSPWLNARRSVSANILPAAAHSTPHCVQSSNLQSRLNDWLKKRGKSLSTFHHLKCFGLHRNHCAIREDDENKENIESPVRLERSESYEALHIEPVRAPEVFDASKFKSLVKDALYDLHKLILEGYPLDQCEQWLGSIRQKYTGIEEESHYWECRAAIERSRGNISCAVECYTTAITKGAEIKRVDESLDQLLKKFSMLNIDTSASNVQECRNDGLTKVCNIFKSSLIQFAVREREIKKSLKQQASPKKYYATPVRRSARLSRSSYVCTPGVQIYNSLVDLEDSVKEELSFKSNAYIH